MIGRYCGLACKHADAIFVNKSPFWQLHLKAVQVVGPVHLSKEHYGVSMWTMMQMVMIEMRSDHLDAFP